MTERSVRGTPPLAYVALLNELYQSLGFPPYDWTVHDDAPWTPLAKPLSACRVSMLTTCGASTLDRPPWDPDARNDFRLDAIPADTPPQQFQVHDHYYDHRAARADINCQFPLTRLGELAAVGVIREVAPRLWSGFMGRIYKRREVSEHAAPAFARALAADGVDLLVVIPACPLDHQTAGLVARSVEAAGIPTITISTARDLSLQVKAPRAVFVNFPMGNACGRPFDIAQQRGVLVDALEFARDAREPGALRDLPYAWGEPFELFYQQPTREYQLRK
jgi:hypothetical protein